MSKDEQLLDEARVFCDPSTGEVLKRIPEELMQKLRMAQLARGVEVEVMYELGEWAFVEFWRSSDNGRQAGWVMAGYLSAVVPDAATAGQARVSQEPGIAVSAP